LRQPSSTERDRELAGRALALAERGRYSTSPNPMVGAVVARNGTIVGEGFHRAAGLAHAEIEALRKAGPLARGATLYVSLEPCVHTGRTGPCVPEILRAGIRRVVASRRDPNPRVAGRGFAALRRSGIDVTVGLFAEESALQNERFDRWITAVRPFVLAKVAASLDGRIADRSGRSRWLTGEKARARGLLWREEFDAILVGSGTVIADDPLLTRRLGRNRTTEHRRIVLDGRLRVSESASVFRGDTPAEVWTAMDADAPRSRRFARRGVLVRSLPKDGRPGSVDLLRGLRALARENVNGLIVEGGAGALGAFADARLVDRWAVFLSPRILGGGALPFPGGTGRLLAGSSVLEGVEIERVGGDILITGRSADVLGNR
jgi:diaminohydroxyphosphoribosylaminopyrimidine deaminase/5-amino-6-(5-phosphoribosylamino)uracil reductase